jgi:hypothetical protein
MPIDANQQLTSDRQILTLAQAAQLIPHRPNAHTLWRWSKKGLRGAKLRTFKVGRSHCTTASLLMEFILASGMPDNTDTSVLLYDSKPIKPTTPSPHTNSAEGIGHSNV